MFLSIILPSHHINRGEMKVLQVMVYLGINTLLELVF